MGAPIRTSQQAISRQVGVSRTAVSHVLNGREHMVGPETRRRILEALAANGYHRNALVRSLKENRTHVIGIIVPNIGFSFFAEIIEAAEAAASELGLQSFLCQTHRRLENIAQEIVTLREYRVDGIIIVNTSASGVPEVYRSLLHPKFPFVVVDVPVRDVETPFVGNDNRLAGRIATDHLIQLGHRKIACLMGYPENPGAKDRYEGYCQALRSAGIAVDSKRVAGDGFEFENGIAAIAELHKRKAVYTAVVAASDYAALGAMRELSRLGRRVPEDVSIVGCGNLNVASMSLPMLTTVDQNPRELGRQAVAILSRQINGQSKIAATALIAPMLIVRESTRPL